MFSGRDIGSRDVPRKEIGQNPHVPGALGVIFLQDRIDRVAGGSPLVGQQKEVDQGHDDGRSVHLLGDPRSKDDGQAFGPGKVLGGSNDDLLGDAGGLLGRAEVLFYKRFLPFQKTFRLGKNKPLVPTVFSHQVLDQGLKEGQIGSGPGTKPMVRPGGQFGFSRIDQNQLGVVKVDGPFDQVCQNRGALAGVGSDDQDGFSLQDFFQGLGGPGLPQGLMQGQEGRGHGNTGAIVQVGGFQTQSGQFLKKIEFFVGQVGACQAAEVFRP